MNENRLISNLINELDKHIENPSAGLPEEVFLHVTTLTPMINVDLLVKNSEGSILMAWRDDLCGAGWHIPGGIIRYKESVETRIRKTAKQELHAEVAFDVTPIAINEIILEQKVRGHFISLLYQCYLQDGYKIDNGTLKGNEAGYLAWIDRCPEQFVMGQKKIYSGLWEK